LRRSHHPGLRDPSLEIEIGNQYGQVSNKQEESNEISDWLFN